MASVRTALRMSLHPFSVVLGLVAALTVSLALWLGAAVVAWVAHVPATGLPLLTLSVIILSLSQCAGGYVAARLSNAKVRAALAVGLLTVALNVGATLLRPSGTVWWTWVFGLAVIVSSAYTGGRLAQRMGAPQPDGADAQDPSHLYATWDATRESADLRRFLDRLEAEGAASSRGPGTRDALVARYPALDGEPEFEALAAYLESSA